MGDSRRETRAPVSYRRLQGETIQMLTAMLHPRARLRQFRRNQRFKHLFNKYHDVTRIPRLQFIANLELIQCVLANPALEHGAMIECGTWKGGMSAAMIEI